MRTLCSTVIAALLALGATAPAQADIAAGKKKAQMCTVCHGPLGIAAMANTPNLAGQPELYLTEQLRAFRSGQRVNPVMSLMAKPLTDEEIADLSAWFASLRVEVREGP